MDWKKILLKIIYPHLAIIICLLPISIVFLTFSLIRLDSTSILAILSYLLAFYLLLVIGLRVPRIVEFVKRLKGENKHLRKYFSDLRFRVNVSLYCSLIFNVIYAIFQLWLGLYHNSFWFYSMFAYYIILGGIRFSLVTHTSRYNTNENRELETKRYILCGWLLLVINIALAVIVFFVVYWNRTFYHHMITTIALATYTFLTLTFAIINLFRYKKYKSPILSAVSNINLIASCVSMLTLETTMLTTFGHSSSPTFRQLILSLTGVAVVGITITVAVIMIVEGKKYQTNSKKN